VPIVEKDLNKEKGKGKGKKKPTKYSQRISYIKRF